MQDYYVCHICGGKMNPRTVKETFHRKDKNTEIVTSKTITEFICENCGERIFESNEVQRIENILAGRSE